MYNLATFDIMGDLTFGDTLNVLTGTGNSHWASFIFDNVKMNAIRRLAGYYPWTSVFLRALIPRQLVEGSIARYDKCKERETGYPGTDGTRYLGSDNGPKGKTASDPRGYVRKSPDLHGCWH